MTEARRHDRRRFRSVSIALFLCLFASQAALIAMSPVLARAASDLHVSTAAAGQLRTITGLAAGITALMLGARRCARRPRPAAAGGLGAPRARFGRERGGTDVRAARRRPGPGRRRRRRADDAGTLAAAEWVAPELRTRTLSWALVGQPAAWIVGMPLIGAPRRAQLALRVACSAARRRRRGGDPRRLARGTAAGAVATRARCAPPSSTARSRAGSRRSCSLTPPGRERSSTRARSLSSRTGRPRR